MSYGFFETEQVKVTANRDAGKNQNERNSVFLHFEAVGEAPNAPNSLTLRITRNLTGWTVEERQTFKVKVRK